MDGINGGFHSYHVNQLVIIVVLSLSKQSFPDVVMCALLVLFERR